MRSVHSKEYSHNLLGDDLMKGASDYDVRRRVEILVDEFLPNHVIREKRVLDVGCGVGIFSARLKEKGGFVTACDIGPSLVESTRRSVQCDARVADALQLIETFGEKQFDIVFSSECIEHTPDPAEALRQMAGVLKPGGWLSISTPNILWQPVVNMATRLKLRPYDGYENFSSWNGMRRTLHESNVTVEREYGLHLIPFQLKLDKFSNWCDGHMQWARTFMINICVLGTKHDS